MNSGIFVTSSRGPINPTQVLHANLVNFTNLKKHGLEAVVAEFMALYFDEKAQAGQFYPLSADVEDVCKLHNKEFALTTVVLCNAASVVMYEAITDRLAQLIEYSAVADDLKPVELVRRATTYQHIGGAKVGDLGLIADVFTYCAPSDVGVKDAYPRIIMISLRRAPTDAAGPAPTGNEFTDAVFGKAGTEVQRSSVGTTFEEKMEHLDSNIREMRLDITNKIDITMPLDGLEEISLSGLVCFKDMEMHLQIRPKNKPFKTGDVVQLISGGPEMTVDELIVDMPNGIVKAKCMYFWNCDLNEIEPIDVRCLKSVTPKA